jgi:thioester reductase-like protein
MPDHLLLTGATGLLGRYLLRDLLARGVPVAALVRPRPGAPAAGRLDRMLTDWETGAGHRLPRPVGLEGDVTAPGLGLSAADADWAARHCGRVLHSAASLEFRGADRTRDPWLTNLTGTEHVLDFCRRAGVRELHHVSTAYVCGRRDGPVGENDPAGGAFRNAYEASKAGAERAVGAAPVFDRATVYRPAVIVGDSRTGYTSTYHGLYPYLRFVAVLARHAPAGPSGRWHLPIRLTLTGDEGRNLVPVDWVSEAITRLVLDPRHHGRTYHLTPARSVAVREIEAAAADYFRYQGPTFVGPGGLDGEPPTDAEREFYGCVELYQPYWAGEPAFDRSNLAAALPDLPDPAVDRDLLRRLIDFAVRDDWGRRSRGPRAAAPAGG